MSECLYSSMNNLVALLGQDAEKFDWLHMLLDEFLEFVMRVLAVMPSPWKSRWSPSVAPLNRWYEPLRMRMQTRELSISLCEQARVET